MGETITPQGQADRGIMMYCSLPGTERIPPQQCLRVVFVHPSGSHKLLGAQELEAPLRHARALTGKEEFTVLIHQFFQKKGEAAILCADILLG